MRCQSPAHTLSQERINDVDHDKASVCLPACKETPRASFRGPLRCELNVFSQINKPSPCTFCSSFVLLLPVFDMCLSFSYWKYVLRRNRAPPLTPTDVPLICQRPILGCGSCFCCYSCDRKRHKTKPEESSLNCRYMSLYICC